MDTHFQTSTWTSRNRHVGLLITADRERGGTFRPRRALSFGCSKGYEIETLLERYPTLETVVGVEISSESLQHCRSTFLHNPKVLLLSSQDFALSSSEANFDIITCFNVLCAFPATPERPYIPFEDFRACVLTLYDRLAPQGTLLLYGANYDLADVQWPEGARVAILPNLASGPVAQFDPVTGKPRGINKVRYVTRGVEGGGVGVEKKEEGGEDVEGKKEEGVGGVQEVKDGLPAPLLPPLSLTPLSGNQIQNQVHSTSSSSYSATTTITLGIFHYPQSSNVGDYTQTLAQINAFSAFYNPSTWHLPSPEVRAAFDYFSSCRPGHRDPHLSRPRSCDLTVHVVWVDRDGTWDAQEASFPSLPVYCITNGWYAHKAASTPSLFQFPFAPWLQPFLVSMHVAEPSLLSQPGVVPYLREQGPVGCRDTATLDLLRGLGVPAYFSSCLTLTLQNPERSTAHARSEHWDVDVQQSHRRPQSRAAKHLDPAVRTQLPDASLLQSLSFFQRYATSASVRGTRIHCLLPASASGVPEVEFVSATGAQDASWTGRSRFSGLLECMHLPQKRELRALALAERLHSALDALLVAGLGREEVMATFRGSTAFLPHVQGEERVDLAQFGHWPQRWEALRLLHPGAVRDGSGGAMDQSLDDTGMSYYLRRAVAGTASVFDYVLRPCPTQNFSACLNILVTFDSGYLPMATTWLNSLSAHNARSLCRVMCHTRNVDEGGFAAFRQRACRLPNVVLLHRPVEKSYEDYSSPLGHVNACCMDRLDVVELEWGGAGGGEEGGRVERVLYIDLDILVLGDLLPMMHLDTGSTGLAAKSSRVRNVMNGWLKKYGIEPGQLHYRSTKSFNAGVFVADRSKLRAGGFGDKIAAMYKQFPVNDQILLNFYANGQYAELPGEYNVFVGQDHAQFPLNPFHPTAARLVHFVGSKKPWLFSRHAYPHDKTLWDLWRTFETYHVDVRLESKFVPR